MHFGQYLAYLVTVLSTIHLLFKTVHLAQHKRKQVQIAREEKHIYVFYLSQQV